MWRAPKIWRALIQTSWVARSQNNPQSSHSPLIPIDALLSPPAAVRRRAANHPSPTPPHPAVLCANQAPAAVPPQCPIQPHVAAPRPHPSRGRRGRIPIEGPLPSSPPLMAVSILCSGWNATHEVVAPHIMIMPKDWN
uniref:Uncharacterized protein n=1 Tax=Oryza barthii TaxID=65489 RepID=A0A0D3H539_9ORYZ